MVLAFKRHIEQIQQRWWVVLLVTAIAVLAAALASLPVQPKYVGKSTLAMSSPGRSPEQDIMTIVGWANLFNDPATKDRLRATKGIPENVTLQARTVPGSPILTIEATADDPGVAQNAATTMAEALRDDLNPAVQTGALAAILDIQRQFRELQQAFPDTVAAMEKAYSLQAGIDTLRSSLSNRLQNLQLQAGVEKIAPRIGYNLVLGAAGGLVLGILAALAMAVLSTRIRSSADLLEKTAIEPLVEVPSARSVRKSGLREDRIRTLGNIVSGQDSPGSLVIALTDIRGTRGAAGIAEALAKVWAQQEYRTLLVYADKELSQSAEDAGFNDVLVDTNLVHQMLKDGEVQSLKILPGRKLFANRHSRVTRERIVAVLDEARAGADIIVVAAPSIAESTDAQLLCATADLTLLVVDTESSRAGDVTSAVEVLRKAHAAVLGVVLIHGTYAPSAGPAISTGRKSLRASETPDHGKHRDSSVATPHR
jgi:polysaccharide biosynthesis transport protein